MILYAHGFNSSPASHKSSRLRERLRELGRDAEFRCPPLSHWPSEAMATLEQEVVRAGGRSVTLVGSSLGGFYATWLTQKHGCRTVLVNPAIAPHVGLRSFLGPQKNLYTGEEYTLTEAHLAQLAALYVPRIDRPDSYLLLQTTGDELLDWREAVQRYAGCRQVVVDGGDHGFGQFDQYLDIVLEFAGAGL